MVLRFLVLLTISAACFAQANKTSPPPQSSDDITALVAEAKQGNVNAQLKLADAYLRGKGIDENDSEGFRWFLAAAEEGSPDGQYNVGSLYAMGKGVNRDDTEAKRAQSDQGSQVAKHGGLLLDSA